MNEFEEKYKKEKEELILKIGEAQLKIIRIEEKIASYYSRIKTIEDKLWYLNYFD